jgi:hypothetical protein
MAKKPDTEFLTDARNENRKESKKFNSSAQQAVDPAPVTETQAPPSAENAQAAADPAQGPAQEPQRDEFREKFDEYFKGMDGVIAGDVAVNMLDDLKASFLFMYVKKQGIPDIGKKDFELEPKSKKFAAFLIDHAVKNNFFDIIKKYPILSALGVFIITGASTFMMLQMLKKSTDSQKAKDQEMEKLRAELEKYKNKRGRDITDVEDLNEKENKTPDEQSIPEPEKVTASQDLKDQIKNL